jgi:2-polyprenyl-3-methyl-5-hydroxy-6-metoxy-1,4-benzoquinol methylase
MREPILYEFENYRYAQGRDLVIEEPETHPLFAGETLDAMLAELRTRLRQDREQFNPVLLQGPVADGIRAFTGEWFQRIDFPEFGISTTSDRAWAMFDEGGVNTLGRHLTSEEACLLRPWPKWLYLRQLLPDLRGKSAMEVGSANGFFPFRFAEQGATRVTGVDVQKRKHESAVWANRILGWKNVEFVNTDFLVDFTIPAHDVVFVSELINHTLCPMWAVTRLLSLARETLIIDSGVFESQLHAMELSTGWNRGSGAAQMLSYQISDGLLVSFLKVLGVRTAEIVKYVESGAGHILYLIDTRGVNARRASGDLAEVPVNQRRSVMQQLAFPK